MNIKYYNCRKSLIGIYNHKALQFWSILMEGNFREYEGYAKSLEWYISVENIFLKDQLKFQSFCLSVFYSIYILT